MTKSRKLKDQEGSAIVRKVIEPDSQAFLLGLVLWKNWQIDCYAIATRVATVTRYIAARIGQISPLSSWSQNSALTNEWKIASRNNGWADNELTADWVQHFDKHTKHRKPPVNQLLILDGHASHYFHAIELYSKENIITALCMPPHSSHILKPSDVACFAPLKRAYGAQIISLVRARVSHILKEDFLSTCFWSLQKDYDGKEYSDRLSRSWNYFA